MNDDMASLSASRSEARVPAIGGIPVKFRKAVPTEDPRARYPGFAPGTQLLRRGTVYVRGGRPLDCDIVVERDVAVKLRDGITIYTDVFRPTHASTFPAIVAWSPYGKRGGSIVLDDFPFRAGVKKKALSGLEKFEGPDPAYWCAHGYAVLNPDGRGANCSEGDIPFWGRQEARDGHDFVEWAAAQPWCNGQIGLTGNSWLAILQWFIAAERPPHLAAIAPWEGLSDLYRDECLRGGIPSLGFNESIVSGLAGNQRVEDVPAMGESHPLMNPYWRDKIPELEAITVPAYIVASWTNLLHSAGTFRAFRRIGSKEKWLRVHNTNEWPDYYERPYLEELRQFFDFYLKGVKNEWLRMPRVRLSILNPGGKDEVNRIETEFPLKRTRQLALHLDTKTLTMSPNPVPAEGKVQYQIGSKHPPEAAFTYVTPKDLELNGYSKLRLWVSAEGSDDMDIFVQLQKLDRRGRWQFSSTIPLPPIPRLVARHKYRKGDLAMGAAFFAGPDGRLRVSHRAVDPVLSTDLEPHFTHETEQRLQPGEIVPVDIPLWPVAMKWRVGECLRLLISGRDLRPCPIKGAKPAALRNQGTHVIHCGGRYDSRLIIPVLADSLTESFS